MLLVKKVWDNIEDDTFLEPKPLGAGGTKVGEIVFNTSMDGYPRDNE